MDLSTLNSFGPWGVIIGVVAYVVWQRYGPKSPTPSPSPDPTPLTPTPSPSAPDPKTNPIAYLIWLLMQSWLKPAEPAPAPVQIATAQVSATATGGVIDSAGDDAAMAALAHVIRSDPARLKRMVDLLTK